MSQICNWRTGALVTTALTALFAGAPAQAGIETVVHSFQSNGTDGYEPNADLIDVGGTLYGATYTGGANAVGTVFSIAAATGKEKIVYSFQNNGADGVNPAREALVDINGTLYGTTYYGGVKSVGTAFALSAATGKEKFVYSFCSGSGVCTEGFDPLAGLTAVGKTLYGTTSAGGSANGGTVFALNRSKGTEAPIYSFQRDGVDGNTPYAGLVSAGGTLYGTTIYGGAHGAGTVFAINPKTGAEKVLYAFAGGTDGYEPYAGVIDVKGMLYGTTVDGGANDYGTVFAVNAKTGAETLLHSFTGGTDGYSPEARLIDVGGTLYGTTYAGGTSGGGTVFAVNPKTGADKVVYAFAGGTDGDGPVAGLTAVGSALYGTTIAGGAYGQGTVFKIKLK